MRWMVSTRILLRQHGPKTHIPVKDTELLRRPLRSSIVKAVWTKLKKGLYVWRKVPTAGRRCQMSQTPSLNRPGKKGSRDAKNTVSLTLSISNSNSTATSNMHKFDNILTYHEAREANVNGSGTALI